MPRRHFPFVGNTHEPFFSVASAIGRRAYAVRDRIDAVLYPVRRVRAYLRGCHSSVVCGYAHGMRQAGQDAWEAREIDPREKGFPAPPKAAA